MSVIDLDEYPGTILKIFFNIMQEDGSVFIFFDKKFKLL